MAAIVGSIEIARPPAEVFAYVTDPSRLGEWQESVVGVDMHGGGPAAVGSNFTVTRKIGRMERPMTSEMTELSSPRSWAIRGIDGPIRGNVRGTIEALDEGARSRVTMEVDLEGHGIGKLLVPLVVRRQLRRELPKNQQNLKQQLEGSAAH